MSLKKYSVPNLIFYSTPLIPGHGGPTGYLCNLAEGFKQEKIEISIVNTSIRYLHFEKTYRFLIKLISMLLPIAEWRKDFRWFLFERLKKIGPPPVLIKTLENLKPATITCHGIDDFLALHVYYSRHKEKPLMILMYHSPEPLSQEKYRCLQHRISRPLLKKAFTQWQKEEKQAFELADYLLFPSPEAMEPCLNNFPWFKELVARKKILFVPTGVPEMKKYSVHDKINLRERFRVKTPFVISFIGRHLEVKGYGLLLSIGEKLLKERDDVTILVGGKIERDSPPPLCNPRWIELGWINPSEVLSISDIFLLPNKETYFDLVLLEALSIGTFVLASNTGGNKTVFQMTKAIGLFNNEDECLELVHAYLNASPSFRQAAQHKSRQAYEAFFTLSHFASGYQKVVSSII